MYPFDIKYNFVMLSQYFVPFKVVLCIAGEKKNSIYAHTMNLNPLLPKFSVILMYSGTSQYNAEEKFHIFMNLRSI